MALSPRRAAERFRTSLRQRFGFQVNDIELLTLLFEAAFNEIKEEMEALNVESPSEGYTVTLPSSSSSSSSTSTTVPVRGTSKKGKIKKGNFR